MGKVLQIKRQDGVAEEQWMAGTAPQTLPYEAAKLRTAGTCAKNMAPGAKRPENSFLKPLVVGFVTVVALLTTICGGGWEVLHLISIRVRSEMQQQAALTLEINQEQSTLHRLHGQIANAKIFLRLDSDALSHSVHLPTKKNASLKTAKPRSMAGGSRSLKSLKFFLNPEQNAHKVARLIANSIERH